MFGDRALGRVVGCEMAGVLGSLPPFDFGLGSACSSLKSSTSYCRTGLTPEYFRQAELATAEHRETQERAFDQRHGRRALVGGAQLQVGVGQDRERLFEFWRAPALSLAHHAISARAEDRRAHARDALGGTTGI